MFTRAIEFVRGAVAHAADDQTMARLDAAATQVVVDHGNGSGGRNGLNGVNLFFGHLRETGQCSVLFIGGCGTNGYKELAAGIKLIDMFGVGVKHSSH